MKKWMIWVIVLLFVGVVVVGAAEVVPTARPLVVELGSNESLMIRCVAPVVDEILVIPQGDREIIVTCRTYVEVDTP